MVDPEYLLDRVVEKIKDNVDEYVVIVSDSNELMAKYARGESTVTQSWRSLNVSIYVAKDSKTFITSFEAESPVKVLDKLGDIIRMLQPNPFYAPLPQPTGQSSSSVDRVVKEVMRLYLELLILEDGYIRFEEDETREHPKIHPRFHFDIFYTNGATFKLGASNKTTLSSFIDLLNLKTECFYLQKS